MMRAVLLEVLGLMLSGCAAFRPVVIVADGDLGLVRMDHNGVPGYWAPHATWAELLGGKQK